MILKKTYYWVIDALEHWVYESFIFIGILIKLNDKYKDIKILTSNKKIC